MRTIFYPLLLLLVACYSTKERGGTTRVVCDALGRSVALSDSVDRIICIRSSAIRLVTYAGGSPFICGIEEQEQRDNHEFTHLFAHPELAENPIIGPRMGGDPELMMLTKPDLIFMGSTTRGEADELQQHTGIPVFVVEAGDLGARRSVFYKSLRQIGEVLHTKMEVERLIHFIEMQLEELQRRITGIEHAKRVYIGAISYRGRKGLISTDPYYAALEFLGVDNVASQMDTTDISPIVGAYIDWEQLLVWNPELIFVDAGGWPLVKQEFQSRPEIFQILTAYRNQQIYLLWPYNNYHSNFEVMLLNAWYIGKVLFPEQFADISMSEKTDEIMAYFVGDTIATDLEKCWGNYRNLFEELNGKDHRTI